MSSIKNSKHRTSSIDSSKQETSKPCSSSRSANENTADSNLRCSRCKSVSYKNVDEQRRDWKQHKDICPLFSLVYELSSCFEVNNGCNYAQNYLLSFGVVGGQNSSSVKPRTCLKWEPRIQFVELAPSIYWKAYNRRFHLQVNEYFDSLTHRSVLAVAITNLGAADITVEHRLILVCFDGALYKIDSLYRPDVLPIPTFPFKMVPCDGEIMRKALLNFMPIHLNADWSQAETRANFHVLCTSGRENATNFTKFITVPKGQSKFVGVAQQFELLSNEELVLAREFVSKCIEKGKPKVTLRED